MDPKIQWPTFAEAFDKLGEKDEIEIVTDNPAYDIEAIDHHLDKEVGRAGVRYDLKMGYRSVHDSTEMVKGLPKHIRDAIKAKTNALSKHTHWAADDAESILVHFFLTKAVIDTMRESEKKIAEILKI